MKKTFLILILTVVAAVYLSGQQVIGTYPAMDGGFENQSGTLATASSISSPQTNWTTQIASTGVIVNTGGRSGPKYVQYSQSGATHRRLQSPTDNVTSASHVVQFFYQGDMDGTIGGDIRGAVSAVGTSAPAYGAYVTDPNTGAVWTKYTAVVTPTGTPANGIGIVSTIQTGLYYIDDFVVYAGSAVDVTAPDSPSSVAVTNPTASSLDVSWTAPSGGVDGGGFVVVRFTSSPDAGSDPNQNGIYAVGNTIPTGGIVAYIGTSSSFTDADLNANTPYWYKVYAVDKAFNYSDEATGNGTTSAGTSPEITVTASLTSFGYVVIGQNSASQSYLVEGTDLVEDIEINAPSGFEISEDDTNWYSQIILYESGGSVDETTLFVRFSPSAAQAYSGNITHESSGAATQNVAVSGTGIKAEPSDHVTQFSAVTGTPSYAAITLSWVDAAKTTPDGYIIKGSDVGYSSIADPVDGVTESWSTLVHTVSQGTQTYVFTGLNSDTTYYFKIFPYTNSGTNIDYKTDETVPQAFETTDEVGWPEDFESGVKTGYTAGYVTCKMGEWYMVQALLGADANDMKFDSKSVRIRYDGTTYGSITTNFLKVNGLGTISFYYARSNFTDDRTAVAPSFVVEYSADGNTWNQAGTTTSLDGVDELTLFSTDVNVDGSYYVRVRQVGGSSGRRWNIDNFSLTDYEPINPVELASFTATISAQNYITLSWVTQTETGMQGYYIYRANSNQISTALSVSPMIAATNSSQQQSYAFTDTEVIETGTYFYWLQTNDMDGTVGFHGPVSVFFNALGDNPTPEIPLVTELKSVYPNPFNPVVFIPFSLAKDSNVSFKIYNARGQIVKHFELGSKAAGNYRITWDGTDYNGAALSNGVYQIVMSAGSQVYQTKTTLLK